MPGSAGAIEKATKWPLRNRLQTRRLARWIALVRFAAAWLAGINRMQFKQFFFWNALGGITWGITFGLVGYYGGRAATHVLATLGIIGAVILGVMLVAFLGFIWVRERRAATQGEED